MEGRELIVVQSGESIQEAIDRAPPGALICLRKGTWTENLTITKPLLLCGAGWGKTKIRAALPDAPVITLKGDEIEVVICGLNISRPSNLISSDGLRVQGKIKLALFECRISNHECGVRVEGYSEVWLFLCRLSGNKCGVWMNAGKVGVEKSVLLGNKGGVHVEASGQAWIVDNTFSHKQNAILGFSPNNIVEQRGNRFRDNCLVK